MHPSRQRTPLWLYIFLHTNSQLLCSSTSPYSTSVEADGRQYEGFKSVSVSDSVMATRSLSLWKQEILWQELLCQQSWDLYQPSSHGSADLPNRKLNAWLEVTQVSWHPYMSSDGWQFGMLNPLAFSSAVPAGSGEDYDRAYQDATAWLWSIVAASCSIPAFLLSNTRAGLAVPPGRPGGTLIYTLCPFEFRYHSHGMIFWPKLASGFHSAEKWFADSITLTINQIPIGVPLQQT